MGTNHQMLVKVLILALFRCFKPLLHRGTPLYLIPEVPTHADLGLKKRLNIPPLAPLYLLSIQGLWNGSIWAHYTHTSGVIFGPLWYCAKRYPIQHINTGILSTCLHRYILETNLNRKPFEAELCRTY